MPTDSEIVAGDAIVQRCLALGFASAGVTEVAKSSHADALRDWLAQGRQGSMAYLERNVELRLDPGAMLQGARSIVMVADQYATRGDSPVPAPNGGGRIARYAQGRDYHKDIKKRLHALCDELRKAHSDHEFRAFVDTAPVLEREHAARAGLGWIGKHTLLIDPIRGSYLFLGGILTTLPIAQPVRQSSTPDHCGACTRCIDACPTDAITPYSVNASRCIAYLTIEQRDLIDDEFHDSIGDWVFGCDICQEVCPHNSPRQDAIDVGRTHDAYTSKAGGFNLLELLGWDDVARSEAFRASAMKRASLDMMRRNGLIAAANRLASEDDPILRDKVNAIATDDSEPALVRDTARSVLNALSGPESA